MLINTCVEIAELDKRALAPHRGEPERPHTDRVTGNSVYIMYMEDFFR